MRALQAKQTELFATAKIDLGAPVLDAADHDEAIVSDGIVAAKGYTPVVITKTKTNAKWKQGDPIPQPVFGIKADFVMPAVGVAAIVLAVCIACGTIARLSTIKMAERDLN